jgi:uncharacterized membrane-anchored protein
VIASNRPVARAAALALLCVLARAARAEDAAPADAPKVKWTPGPAQVQVGELAQVELPDALAFAGAEDTRALLERMGNPTDGSELGLVVPKAQDQDWFIVFEWAGIGYVKDDEKDKIDADALLKSIREGTEESNAERKKRGRSPLHVVGWAEPPRYDARTHNLTWAVLARNEEGHESVNYNVRVLGREGVMSITLVEEPKLLAQAKPAVEQVIAAFTYHDGKRYAQWVPGDKVAKYGLTALVAAGAGAAAAKLGLFAVLAKIFAKAGKAIAVGIAALGAVGVKFWNALRGKASARPGAPPAA